MNCELWLWLMMLWLMIMIDDYDWWLWFMIMIYDYALWLLNIHRYLFINDQASIIGLDQTLRIQSINYPSILTKHWEFNNRFPNFNSKCDNFQISTLNRRNLPFHPGFPHKTFPIIDYWLFIDNYSSMIKHRSSIIDHQGCGGALG